MSTRDLAAIGVLPQLLAAGVTSFKIEGRMKDAAYVGVTTAVYRSALDAALADPEGYEVRPEWMAHLEQSFSRSFSTAHLEGRPHEVRSGGRGGHRGVLVGRVARVDEARGEIEVRLSKPVGAGDLVYFYTPWGQSEPMRLAEGGETSVTLRAHERVAVKDRLFRLAAAEAGELAQDLITGRVALRPIAVRMRLDGKEGAPAQLTVTRVDGGGEVVVTAPPRSRLPGPPPSPRHELAMPSAPSAARRTVSAASSSPWPTACSCPSASSKTCADGPSRSLTIGASRRIAALGARTSRGLAAVFRAAPANNSVGVAPRSSCWCVPASARSSPPESARSVSTCDQTIRLRR